MAQLWAQAADHYYGIPRTKCFSGRTEATAFNPRAVEAMKNVGYDDPSNSVKELVVIMTCSYADRNCPIVCTHLNALLSRTTIRKIFTAHLRKK